MLGKTCPLLSDSESWEECLGDKCALWSAKNGSCALAGIIDSLAEIESALARLAYGE